MRTVATLAVFVISRIPWLDSDLKLLPSLIARGACCLDIDAAYGMYAIPMGALASMRGRVIACEPQSGPRRVRRSLGRLLGLRNVEVLPFALARLESSYDLAVPVRRSGRTVRGRAYICPSGSPTVMNDDLWLGRRVRVEATTIDEIRSSLGAPVAFIKCDVEGFELEVLRGGERTLLEDRPSILCEIEERHTARYGHRALDVLAYTASLGYIARRRGRNRRVHPERDGRRAARIVAGASALAPDRDTGTTDATPQRLLPTPQL